MSLIQIAQSIANMITGQLGTLIIVIAVAFAAVKASIHGHWGHMWSAIGGGAVLISAAWIVQTFLGAGAA